MNIKKTSCYLLSLSCAILLLVCLPIETNSAHRFLKQLLVTKNGQILRALFTPKDDVRQTIINLIHSETQAIKVASYFFTDHQMANALITAHNKGVQIEIITDQKHLESCEHTKIFDLGKAGINIYVFKNINKYGIFHHKFMEFTKNFNDATLLLTGSFNFTSMAQEQNQENVIITDNSDITNSYEQQFKALKKQSQTLDKFIKQQKPLAAYRA